MRTRRVLGWVVLLLLVTVVGVAVQGAGDEVAAAAKDGDLAEVRRLIAARADVNAPGRDGSTALLWAAYNGNLEMTRALLAAGAKPDIANRYGLTPLLQASRTGDTAIITALLTAGATRTPHPEGETPLMAAARSGKVDAIRVLLTRGADVNAQDAHQAQTALMWAAADGHTAAVRALLEAGADPNIQAHVNPIFTRDAGTDHPSGGFTALMFAARNGHEETVKTLMEGGANPSLANGDGVYKLSGATAMILAIINDRFDLAAKMLEWGADPNDGSLFHAVDMHDATTDMYARDGSRLRANFANKLTALDLVKLLLDKGADPNKPFVGQLHNHSLCCGDFHNATPLYRASIAADVEVLKLLIAKGANVEWAPGDITLPGRGGGRGGNANSGRQPIFAAMAGGRGAAFGGGPGFGRQGPPPWREPGSRKPADAVKLLLEAGADPNAWGPNGEHPIHAAVQAGNLDVIRMLAAHGARLDWFNREGYTALTLAEKRWTDAKSGRGRGRGAGDGNVDGPRPAPPTKPEEVVALVRELMGLPMISEPPAPEPEPAADKPDTAAEAAQ
jgi:ankyrin repeat protein